MMRMAKKRPKADRHLGTAVMVRVTEQIHEILRQLAFDERRSVTQTTIILIEDALRSRGLLGPRCKPPTDRGKEEA